MLRTTRIGRTLALVVLLAAAARGAVAPGDDLDRFQGTWDVVTLERGGRTVPPERLKGRTVIIEGTTFTDRTGEKLNGKGTLKLDPTKSPRAVDATFTGGVPKGKTSLAIYELDGDTLKACSAEPGDDRPTAFAAKPGTGLMLVVLRRHKP